MKRIGFSLSALFSTFAALALGGCGADNSAIWYDDGEGACFEPNEKGEEVEVPCPNGLLPGKDTLEMSGGCNNPDICNEVEINGGVQGAPNTSAMWEFIGNQPLSINGTSLSAVARYAATTGPCYGRPAGTCLLDSRTIFFAANGNQIESVTAYGRHYNWTINAGYAPWPGNGGDLTGVPRYQSGPCANKAPGTCVFDSRTVATVSGIPVESVTAYGMYWNWNAETLAPLGSGILNYVNRYATGPCNGKPISGCVFDTREIMTVNGQQIESITAYGKYWNYDMNGNLLSSSDLTTIPRYTAPTGPCYGAAAGTCLLRTRAVYSSAGSLIETIAN